MVVLMLGSFFSSCGNGKPDDDDIIVQDTLVILTVGDPGHVLTVQQYGVKADNSAADNARALQKAIDEAAKMAASVYVTPCRDGYKCDGGIVLRKGVTLFGANSAFIVNDNGKPFISMESSSCLQGLRFIYPQQATDKPVDIKEYSPTVTLSGDADADGVTLRELSFLGEYQAVDFTKKGDHSFSQVFIRNCKGYSLSGNFITVDGCKDAPRIIDCDMRPDCPGMSFSPAVIDAVVARENFAYKVDNTCGMSMDDIHVFGDYGGVKLGAASSGHLTEFSLECVSIGVSRDGKAEKAYDWNIFQGTINACVGSYVQDIHPFYITGQGQVDIADVNSVCQCSDALTCYGKCYDFITVAGDREGLSVMMLNCKMASYEAECPITILNDKALVKALSCVDRDTSFFDFVFGK